MAETIKGINVVIGAETTGLQKAMSDVNKKSKDLQSELRQVDRLLKLDPGNTELVAQKQKLLADAIENSKEKLDRLKKAQEQVNEQFKKGEITEEQYRAFQREIVKTEQELKKLKSEGLKVQTILSKEDAVNNLKKIGAAAGVAAVALGGALVGAAVKAGQSADEINTMAKVTGLSTEQIQKFQYASDRIDVSLETLTGSMAKLTKNMGNAQKGTKASVEAFEALKVSYMDGNGQLRDNNEVFNEVIDALAGIENETQRDAYAMELFGKKAQDLNPLILGGADALKQMGEEAEAAGVILSQDALDAANEFNDALDKIKALSAGMFSVIGAEVATSLLPAFESLLRVVEELPQWIERNATLLAEIGVAIGTVTALVIAFNVQQALLASGMTLWAAVAGVAAGVTTVLGAAFAFLVSPIGLIILAIGALVAAGVLIYRNWDTIKAKMSEVWGMITDFFTKDVPAAIGTALKWFGELPGKIAEFINQLPGKIGYALGLALGSLIQFGLDAINWAIIEVPNFIENVIKFYMELPGKIAEWLKKALEKVIEWGGNLISWAKKRLPTIISSIVGFFADLPRKLLDIGVEMVKGLWNGIQSMVGWIGDKIKGFVGGIVSGIKAGLDIQSPSRVMADIGKNISLGLAEGMLGATDAVDNAINGLLGTMLLRADLAGAGTTNYNNGGNTINITVQDGEDLISVLQRVGVRVP